jgi:hypothetical protein
LLHQVGDLFELNVKQGDQKVKVPVKSICSIKSNKLTEAISFFSLCSASKLKKTTFHKQTLLVLSGKVAPNLVDPLYQAQLQLYLWSPLDWLPLFLKVEAHLASETS